MLVPKTKRDLEFFIENQIQEDIHLDYKASPALDRKKIAEISKDVSAFANSDGGLIIYGIREDEEGHYPKNIDEGVPNTLMTKEWLENSLKSNINPSIDGLVIHQIRLSDTHSAYSIEIPKSSRAPHQEGNKKVYYKRYNFSSVAMEHYEILDIQNRKTTNYPFVDVKFNFSGGYIDLIVEHVGDLPIKDLVINIEHNLDDGWDKNNFGGIPAILTKGMKVLYPKRKHTFIYGYCSNLQEKFFNVTASYIHPYSNQRVSDEFQYNVAEIANSLNKKTEVEELTRSLVDIIKDLNKSLEKISNSLEELTNLTNPTGLALSVSSLRNIKHLLDDQINFEKINPVFCSALVFEEVLKVDRNMAYKIHDFFSWQPDQKLEDIEGMTPELLQQIALHFEVKA